jgi:hypothetical protein
MNGFVNTSSILVAQWTNSKNIQGTIVNVLRPSLQTKNGHSQKVFYWSGNVWLPSQKKWENRNVRSPDFQVTTFSRCEGLYACMSVCFTTCDCDLLTITKTQGLDQETQGWPQCREEHPTWWDWDCVVLQYSSGVKLIHGGPRVCGFWFLHSTSL